MKIRGVHLDCRAQMVRFDVIIEIFKDIARWGYSTVLLEYSDKFPFTGTLQAAVAPDALTRDQVIQLVTLTKKLGIRIIPLIQCLGYLDWMLRPLELRRYGDDWYENQVISADISHYPAFYSICPSNEEAVALLYEMANQVLELHPDCRYFHMGGDEVLLDKKKSCVPGKYKDRDLPHILLNHYVHFAAWLKEKGLMPIIWCDMPLAHPEILDSLKESVVIMDFKPL